MYFMAVLFLIYDVAKGTQDNNNSCSYRMGSLDAITQYSGLRKKFIGEISGLKP